MIFHILFLKCLLVLGFMFCANHPVGRCQPSDLTVAVNPIHGNDSISCNVVSPCRTIAYALLQRNATTVALASALFSENTVVVTAPQVTVLGASDGSTTFSCKSRPGPAFVFLNSSVAMSKVTFSDCHNFGTISSFEGFGGAVLAVNCSIILNSCIFKGNSAVSGGAVAVIRSNFVITSSVFSGNSAVATCFSTLFCFALGGAIFASESNSIHISNCVLSYNMAVVNGSNTSMISAGGCLSVSFDNDAISSNISVVNNTFLECTVASSNSNSSDFVRARSTGGALSILFAWRPTVQRRVQINQVSSRIQDNHFYDSSTSVFSNAPEYFNEASGGCVSIRIGSLSNNFDSDIIASSTTHSIIQNTFTNCSSFGVSNASNSASYSSSMSVSRILGGSLSLIYGSSGAHNLMGVPGTVVLQLSSCVFNFSSNIVQGSLTSWASPINQNAVGCLGGGLSVFYGDSRFHVVNQNASVDLVLLNASTLMQHTSDVISHNHFTNCRASTFMQGAQTSAVSGGGLSLVYGNHLWSIGSATLFSKVSVLQSSIQVSSNKMKNCSAGMFISGSFGSYGINIQGGAVAIALGSLLTSWSLVGITKSEILLSNLDQSINSNSIISASATSASHGSGACNKIQVVGGALSVRIGTTNFGQTLSNAEESTSVFNSFFLFDNNLIYNSLARADLIGPAGVGTTSFGGAISWFLGLSQFTSVTSSTSTIVFASSQTSIVISNNHITRAFAEVISVGNGGTLFFAAAGGGVSIEIGPFVTGSAAGNYVNEVVNLSSFNLSVIGNIFKDCSANSSTSGPGGGSSAASVYGGALSVHFGGWAFGDAGLTLWNTLVGLFIPRNNRISSSYISVTKNTMINCAAETASVGNFNGGASGSSAYGGCASLFFGAHSITTRSGENSTYIRFVASTVIVTSDNVMSGCRAVTRVAGVQNGGLWGCQARGGALAVQLGPLLYVLKGLPNSNGFLNGIFLDLPNQVGGGSSGLISLTGVSFSITRNSFTNSLALVNNTEFFSFGSGSFSTGGGLNFLIGTEVIVESKKSGFNDFLKFGTSKINFIDNTFSECSAVSNLSNSKQVIDNLADPVQTIASGGAMNLVLGSTLLVQQSVTNGVAASLGAPISIQKSAIKISGNTFLNCNATSFALVMSTSDSVSSIPLSFTTAADVFGGSVAVSIGHLNLARRVKKFELSPSFSVNGTCQATLSNPGCSVVTAQCSVPDYLPQFTDCFLCTQAGNVWISNIDSQYPGIGQCVFAQYGTDTFFPSGLLLPTSKWQGIRNMSNCPGVFSAPFAKQTLQLIDRQSKNCPICTLDSNGVRRQWCVTLSLCLPYSITCPVGAGVDGIFAANQCFDKKNARYFPTCLSCVGQNGDTSLTEVLQWCNSSINGPCQRIGSPCDGPIAVRIRDCAAVDVYRSSGAFVGASDCFSCVKQFGFWITGIGNNPQQGEPNAGACFKNISLVSILGSNNFIAITTIDQCPGLQWPDDITSCVRCVSSSFTWCLASASCILRSLSCPDITDIGVTTGENCFSPRTASHWPSCSSCLNQNLGLNVLQWCASIVPIGGAETKGTAVIDMEISIDENIFSNSSVVAKSTGNTRSLHAFGGGIFLGIGNKVYSDSAVAATIGSIDIVGSKITVMSNVFKSCTASAFTSASSPLVDIGSYGGGIAFHFNSIVSGFSGNLTDPFPFELQSKGSSLNVGPKNIFEDCHATTTSSQCSARASAVGGALFVSPPPVSPISTWSISIRSSLFRNNSAVLKCSGNSRFGLGVLVSGGAVAITRDSYSAPSTSPYFLTVFNCTFSNSFPVTIALSAMSLNPIPSMVFFDSVAYADISYSSFTIFRGNSAMSGTTLLYATGDSVKFSFVRFDRRTSPNFPAVDPIVWANVTNFSILSTHIYQDDSISFSGNNTVFLLTNSGRSMLLAVVDSVFEYSGTTSFDVSILSAPAQTTFSSTNASLYCRESIAAVSNSSMIESMFFQCTRCNDGQFAHYGNRANLSNAQLHLAQSRIVDSSAFCSSSSLSGTTVCPFGSSSCSNYVAVFPGFWSKFIPDRSMSNSFFLLPPKRCPPNFCICNGTAGNTSCNLNPPIAMNVANNQDHICASNRTGVLCGSCNPGYTASLDGFSCIPNEVCATTVVGVWSLALFTYFLYGLFIALTSGQESDGVVEVFLYFQQISALSFTPPLREEYSNFQSFVDNVQRTCGFVSPGQVLKSTCLGPDMSNLDLLVALTFLPVTLVTIFTFFWIQVMMLIHKYHRKFKVTVVRRGKSMKAIRVLGIWLRPTWTGAGIQLIFYAFTSLVTSTFQTVDCVNMGDDLKSRFLYDGNRLCYDGLWIGMITFVCLLAIVPVAFMGYFFKFRREILKHDNLTKILEFEDNISHLDNPHIDNRREEIGLDLQKIEQNPSVTSHVMHTSASVPASHVAHHNLRRVASDSMDRRRGPDPPAALMDSPALRRGSDFIRSAVVKVRRISNAVMAIVKHHFIDRLHAKVYVCLCHQFTPQCAWWSGLELFYRFIAVGSSAVNPPPTASFLLMLINIGMLLITATLRPYRLDFAQKLDMLCKAILVIQFAVSMFVQQPEMVGIPNSILLNSPGAVELIESFNSSRNAFSMIPILALCFFYGKKLLPQVKQYFKSRNMSRKSNDDAHEMSVISNRPLTLDNEEGDYDRTQYASPQPHLSAFLTLVHPNSLNAASQSSTDATFSSKSSATVSNISIRPLISKQASARLPRRNQHAEDLPIVMEHSESSQLL